MNMNKEQIGMAIQAGLELLGPESDVKVPTKLNDGVFFLKGLLAGIAQGKISLGEGKAALPPEDPAPPAPPAPPKTNRKVRRAVRAVTRKKAATKKAAKKTAGKK